MNNPLIELHYPDGTVRVQQLHHLKEKVKEIYILSFNRATLEVQRRKYENTNKN